MENSHRNLQNYTNELESIYDKYISEGNFGIDESLLSSAYLGNVDALLEIGDFFRDNNHPYEMQKFYLSGHKIGHKDATERLQLYYFLLEKNSNERKGEIFWIIGKGFDEMGYTKKSKEYLLKSMENGFLFSYSDIGKYYFNKKKYEKMKNYLTIGKEKGCQDCSNILKNYHKSLEK